MQVLVRMAMSLYVVSCPHCRKPVRYVKKSDCYGVVGAAREAVRACKGKCWACGRRLTGFEQE